MFETVRRIVTTEPITLDIAQVARGYGCTDWQLAALEEVTLQSAVIVDPAHSNAVRFTVLHGWDEFFAYTSDENTYVDWHFCGVPIEDGIIIGEYDGKPLYLNDLDEGLIAIARAMTD